ncbi:GNAT family N-acetyltransferase [Chromatium okenii]|jgi:GNAT superfamily N-acetyltransferase|uniref:GNAT family N-acetyltransferase n=1 Tax=Chromatium okenii TaxID=61644 RepID=A0A2S7XM90_9GAMM|nr:GNAT family N-acetyltransferase [Chromatium okenii]PQJ94742.1 GNAT family N-acetyltransferase [Chromatium okenii]PQJ94766.1 GNAT family N-acetyltransferase [Chromatium okenii]PQJ94790.1 GNAT family N-acetyltransferase [Chromatium okenii]PQJ94810.1 GNAT family N-acetyltransferase [Chromatium okenii]
MAVCSAPTRLTIHHDLIQFDSGEPSLDQWLQQRAVRNEGRGASRTYVIDVEHRVIGYYCLATASIASDLAPGHLRRNMPDPIPAMVLGRLAVDRHWHGQGLGKALLRDAILRTVQVSEFVGVKALLVHALSEAATLFYLAQGFHPFPHSSNTLFLPLSEVKQP